MNIMKQVHFTMQVITYINNSQFVTIFKKILDISVFLYKFYFILLQNYKQQMYF